MIMRQLFDIRKGVKKQYHTCHHVHLVLINQCHVWHRYLMPCMAPLFDAMSGFKKTNFQSVSDYDNILLAILICLVSLPLGILQKKTLFVNCLEHASFHIHTWNTRVSTKPRFNLFCSRKERNETKQSSQWNVVAFTQLWHVTLQLTKYLEYNNSNKTVLNCSQTTSRLPTTRINN